ncbi:hypothetical protein MRB53_008321 [Persea americana]|uniref:Uncharacterized protein n=1 Tax=Persea americana TaxID=3435 RepID=A0ACC2MMI0_PERAE|nr:hypothetical protein MRB53_008321 [Persea americana]|eukprot:TRINITY_DN17156_c0_g1_i1.p1 TRINITY_DN17156_c0_g1~~TRINITY_DN17156_c0_g1_i1.p1  ORF type:complete len:222 (-),score=69.00 TRINITY_DN17156_c0_g1_i1:338-1003(-)
MEAPAAPALSHFNFITRPPSFSLPFLTTVSQSQHPTSSSSHCFNSSSPSKQRPQLKVRQLRSLKPVEATPTSEIPSSDSDERWILEPIGDGDWRHLGFKVPLPNAFEIASNVVTVGRVPEKANVVIPVATVSGLHARLEKKEGNLLVTDLDSTNGTVVDDKKLIPGAITTVPPGSCLIFGDTHLAMFRVLKLEKVDLPSKTDESEMKLETDGPTESVEAMS